MVTQTAKPAPPTKIAKPATWFNIKPRFVKTVGPLSADPPEMTEAQKVYAIEDVLRTHCSDTASAKKALRAILVIHDLPSPPEGEGGAAIAGSPGAVDPVPADLAELTSSGTVASPLTAWTTGQHIVLGDASTAYWDGSAWVVGVAP